MSDWQQLRLGDVLTLQRGFDITKKQQRPGPIPVVSSSGISSTHAESRAEGPGVVIGRKGSLGTTFFLHGPFWPHDTTLWVKDFKGNDPFFCYLLLKGLRLSELDAGSSNPTLNRNHVHMLEVATPGVVLQRRIAAVLFAFDQLIEINERRIALLEDLARSLYREWFVHFRFPGHEDVEFVDSELGPIPEGWEVVTASAVFEVNPRVHGAQASYPKVTMADVDEHFSHVLPSNEANRLSGSRFTRGDVLFARITPCLENGKTAIALFLRPDEVGIGSTEFIVLRGIDVGPAFVYCAARSDELRGHAIKSMSGASGRQRVSNDCFESLLMAAPDPAVALRFDGVVGPMLEAVLGYRVQNEQLAGTRDLLLPRLVTGRLDISDVDLGDLLPAEAL
jgi:type I restriction enzyme S subunit